MQVIAHVTGYVRAHGLSTSLLICSLLDVTVCAASTTDMEKGSNANSSILDVYLRQTYVNG
jgi:hypothetical protein